MFKLLKKSFSKRNVLPSPSSGASMTKQAKAVSSSTDQALAFVQEQVNKYEIVVFAKSWCPYCQETKHLLHYQPEFANITVQTYNLDEMPNGAAIQRVLYQMTQQRTVPSVWVNGRFLGGNDQTQSAYRTGRLSKMLQL